MSESEHFSIHSTVRNGKPHGLPFEDMKNAILGPNYELSLVFIGSTRSRTLNLKFRGKDKPTNVLSFPLSDNEGEIFICPEIAKKEAPAFGMNGDAFMAYLFIHGCLHLKGYRHGSKMDSAERTYTKRFNLS